LTSHSSPGLTNIETESGRALINTRLGYVAFSLAFDNAREPPVYLSRRKCSEPDQQRREKSSLLYIAICDIIITNRDMSL